MKSKAFDRFVCILGLLLSAGFFASTPNAKWRGGEPFSQTDKVFRYLLAGFVMMVFLFGFISSFRKKGPPKPPEPLPPPF